MAKSIPVKGFASKSEAAVEAWRIAGPAATTSTVRNVLRNELGIHREIFNASTISAAREMAFPSKAVQPSHTKNGHVEHSAGSKAARVALGLEKYTPDLKNPSPEEAGIGKSLASASAYGASMAFQVSHNDLLTVAYIQRVGGVKEALALIEKLRVLFVE